MHGMAKIAKSIKSKKCITDTIIPLTRVIQNHSDSQKRYGYFEKEVARTALQSPISEICGQMGQKNQQAMLCHVHI
jgi:hypothetical protein